MIGNVVALRELLNVSGYLIVGLLIVDIIDEGLLQLALGLLAGLSFVQLNDLVEFLVKKNLFKIFLSTFVWWEKVHKSEVERKRKLNALIILFKQLLQLQVLCESMYEIKSAPK